MRGFLRGVFLYEAKEGLDLAVLSRLLERGAMAAMAFLIVLTFTSVNLQALFWQSSNQLVGTVLPALVVEQTNIERADRYAPPLRRNHVLDEAAARKAEHMAAQGYFSHYSPDGVSPWQWFDEVGYTYAFAGENLAVHFSDSNEVVEAWMQSPPQRDNILSGNYTEIGVGTAKGSLHGHETVFVVQMFGSPAMKVATPLPRVDAPILAEISVPTSTIAIFSADSAARTGDNATTTSVLTLVTSSEMVVAAESTPRTESNVTLPTEPPVPITDYEITDAGISFYSGMAATSSGLPMIMESAPDTSAGATKTAFVARVATEPNTIIAAVYTVLSIVVLGMLLLSILLALRAHRPWQMVHSFLLLVLMVGLISLHFYLTEGAMVV